MPLESALDKYYLEELLRTSATPDEDNSRILHSFIGSQVDITNIKIISQKLEENESVNELSPDETNESQTLTQMIFTFKE